MSGIEARIKARAAKLGFDRTGIAKAGIPLKRSKAYLDFIADGFHGEMHWLARDPERRSTPQGLWPQAKSVVVCAMNYGPSHDPLSGLSQTDRGIISVYAGNRDYHDVIKGRLKDIAGLVARECAAKVKVFVDTAPLLEKPLAELAGIGWQGKHTNLVARGHGSWLLLGEILTEAELVPDAPEVDHCGSCSKCMAVCPTDAFPAPYRLDARRCISYLTIEHPGPIPRQFRRLLGNRIYGCDDCLAVCPWNKFARAASEAKLVARPENVLPDLTALLDLDDASFRQRFAGSPIKRIGRDRFMRNVLIAAGNADMSSAESAHHLTDRVERLLDDSAAIVRGAAVWAFARRAVHQRWQEARQRRLRLETDAQVIEEWITGHD